MIRELIEKASTADKPGLIEMLSDLGLKADNRKGEDTLRAELITGLEKALADEADDVKELDPDPVPGNSGIAGQDLGRHIGPVTQDGEDDQLNIPQALVAEASIPGSNIKSVVADPAKTSVLREAQAPDLDDAEDEQERLVPIAVNRLLRNTRTGCEFVWTTELAKLSYMHEV
ncbi:hypothetical protein [Pseudomonas sp. 5P_3.1_Bac2]|uniref:hypothetical protein n=1 Tax=Pseudomonas sp. 5P_3.1_Bac2 TaxID=2971617 RepID=UPI0021CA061A|nr:hypothetical protein [Pseudomonas sp. 5P_3.1_Bac2]MCU1717317.1 hypothetical protein [Pseudomonas sp. 5P_3.1_Bac2]